MKIYYKHYEIRLSGHLTDDYDYYIWINKLYKKVFNANLNFKALNKEGYLKVSIDSKAIVTFLSEVIGIPLGNKISTIFVSQIKTHIILY